MPDPQTEELRLAALRAYRILDTGEDPAFDRITDLASRIFRVPFAAVSLVDERRVWYKSHFGVEVREVAREGAPSNLVIESPEVFFSLDARRDPRFPNPPTIGGMRVAFYAGAPLVDPAGFRIGALSVVDTRHRPSFSDEEAGMLRDVAAMAMDELELQLELMKSRETAASLRASEARFRAVMETASQGIIGVVRDGTIRLVNRKAETLFGYSRDELVGQSLETLIPEALRGHHAADRARYFENPHPRPMGIGLELRGRHKEGKEFPVEISLNHLDVDGEKMAISFITDISERTRLENQLRQSQKMEAVGQLAGGVAHDFNNLLTVISGYSNLALAGLPPEHELKEPIEEISRAAERAGLLTQQLLAFSRQQVVQPRRFKLNDRVEQTHRILKRLIGEDILLEIALGDDAGEIMADPGQIDQVLLNLAVNARDAMPNGGRILVETASVAIGEAYASTHFDVRPGPHVMLAVTDTGSGMTPEVQAHIFEPFFTTKGVGKGTGLGLATVYGIVKQAGGSIFLYSELGRGTTFKIVFPRAVEGRVEEPAVAAEEPNGAETILLVEDEETVRRFVRTMLRTRGYRVLEAANGEEALKVIEEHADEIDLVLTDVVMPKIGGPELVSRLRLKHPQSKVLYMSGYTDRTVPLQDEGGAAFIQKPFTPKQLNSKLREILQP
jgi:two-component system, cell cycle sensor histidine kinase and response regulator CckA